MTDLEEAKINTETKKDSVLKLSINHKISLSSPKNSSQSNFVEKRSFAVVRKRGKVSSLEAQKSINDKSNLTNEEAQARLNAFQRASELSKIVKQSQDAKPDNVEEVRDTKDLVPQDGTSDSPENTPLTPQDLLITPQIPSQDHANTKSAADIAKEIKKSNASEDDGGGTSRNRNKKVKLQQEKSKNSTKSEWKKILGSDNATNATVVVNRNKSLPKFRKKLKTERLSKPIPKKIVNTAIYSDKMSVSDLAGQIKEKTSNVIKFLNQLDIEYSEKDSIDYEIAELIINEFGHQLKKSSALRSEDLFEKTFESTEHTSRRPPVVTIMGHVDHGKTSLLDAIRYSNVTNLESGGITQHIGAYQTKSSDGQYITFIDTPGHAAFTAMRARGAKITDIVVLVIAADDGIMEQTAEAINHIKSAAVPVIVAINKIDKPGADVSKVTNLLPGHNLLPEEYGGDVLVVPVSAKEKKNIDGLKEAILLQAEIIDLGCNPNGQACGVVLESKIAQKRGVIVSLLVQNGSLKIGDFIVAGTACGRVRAMLDHQNQRIKKATPSTPVEIMGMGFVSEAGERFAAFTDEKSAKALVEHRIVAQKQVKNDASIVDIQKMMSNQQRQQNILNIVLKADTQGSIEAISTALSKLSNADLEINVAHSAVGAISESDVILAQASQAKILAFNVGSNVNAHTLLKKHNLDIDSYGVIYDLLDDVENLVKGSAPIVQQQKYIGAAVIRQIFDISKVGKIAGCYVTDGLIRKDATAKLLRDGIVIYEGAIKTLRRFKENVKEVGLNFECGLVLEKYGDIKEDDIIQAFEIV